LHRVYRKASSILTKRWNPHQALDSKDERQKKKNIK
jgi:hypothetical protein